MTLIVIAVITLLLFCAAFFTQRRFGVLGLALAAGVVLAQNGSVMLGDLMQKQNFSVEPLTYSSAATIFLILAPALILLFGGPTYSDKRSAFVGSLGFALLGIFFLLGPLTTALPTTDETVRDVLVKVSQSQNVIVILALLLALIDTFMVHGPIGHHRRSSKH